MDSIRLLLVLSSSIATCYVGGMNILMLGGTRFVGRHLVEEAVRKGHQLTLFNRGNNAGLFPDLAFIAGDRTKPEDLAKLALQTWDAVIDSCAYYPRQVKELLEQVAPQTEHYTLISTISVYKQQTLAFQDESAELIHLADDPSEEVGPESYGGLKVLCERMAEELMPSKVLIPRPGLIVGPHDGSDRFSYWPYRIAQGGEVLVPDASAQAIQYIDVRDLASWTISMIEKGQTGCFNLLNTPDSLCFADVLEASKRLSQSDARFCYLGETFLEAQQVAPWTDLPLWLPGALSNFLRLSNQKALKAGLSIRPLDETIRDTLIWLQSLPAEYAWKAGLAASREQELLAKWHRLSADT